MMVGCNSWIAFNLVLLLHRVRIDATNDHIKDPNSEKLLRQITDLTLDASGVDCVRNTNFKVIPLTFSENIYPEIRDKMDLVGFILKDTTSIKDKLDLMKSSICRISQSSTEVRTARFEKVSHEESEIHYQEQTATAPSSDISTSSSCKVQYIKKNKNIEPWFRPNNDGTWDHNKFQIVTPWSQDNKSSPKNTLWTSTGRWTFPYFECNTKKWIVTYVLPVRNSPMGLPEFLSGDVDVSKLDINQCDSSQGGFSYFRDTHKCHRESTRCVFEPNFGWQRGGYRCECRDGFYSMVNSSFNGSLVEVAWQNHQDDSGSGSYDYLYVCRPCASGCGNCTDGSPCEAEYNMPFRITLLTISMLCIFMTIIVMALVYHYRSVKVFKVASPAFLEICLFGCIVMYLEMATIFPILDLYSCIATKWARHMGFCITFSSLLMKTWRVSLTYRVKSAHKIKLTDKQLLQWMTPILLIMIIYLGAWTISDPPVGELYMDSAELHFKQCTYNWWDHALAIGEMLFLLWGVKVCYGVRKAESFFDEAKCISYAVYNITAVNVVMASFHVFIFPNAGPDLKYFFGFIRTQMSTTTTIGLVFGPKLLRVLKGTGDQLDNRARAKGVTASFSINGIGGNGDEPPDPLEENEELKEEIQKLAAQIEFMKIVHMEMNNRHLKPKPGGYFTEKSSTLPSLGGQSPPILKTSKMEENSNRSTLSNPTDPPAEKV